MSGFIGKMLGALRDKAEARRLLRGNTPLSYEQARDLASHSDPAIRGELARRSDLRPEILYFLAEDPVAEVRRQIAANPATPVQADLHLAADSDPSVRGDLAQKIARLAPGLSADEQDRLRHMTYGALELLARDQITRVRQILAEALKDVADAPPDLIRRLAHDSELMVSSPILEFSPVLSDEDLLEIIRSDPAVGALSAISRRKEVGEKVADRIAVSADIDAVAVLLANQSAQIREETLDRLLDRAMDHEAWHAPLVRRPQLSTRAATRLARFVADNLLQVLERRADFDPSTKAAVAAAVRRRVEEGASDMAAFRRGDRCGSAPDNETDRARRLFTEGKLTEAAVVDALAANQTDFAIAGLATLAGVSEARVRKIIAMQSPKGTLALAWKAGFGMATAVTIQTKLAKVAPSDVLRPRPGTHSYPMSPSDMQWQLDFFGSMVGEGATG